MKPRIAFFLPFLGGRGANMVMLTLANGFCGRGYNVDFVLAEAKGELLDALDRRIRLVNLKSPRGVLRSLPAFSRYLREAKPDVLVTAMDYVNVLTLLLRKWTGVRTRVIISSHNSIRPAIRQSAWLRDRLLPFGMRMTYRWSDGIVAVSHGVANALREITNLPRDRVRVIYNPVVTPNFTSRTEEALAHPWFGEGALPVVLTVGKLAPEKDLPTLLRAFAKVIERRAARLMIVGSGDEEQKLRALVKDLDIESKVRFEGFKPNPLPYMKRASLFVLSSKYEGFGLVLAEALACGTPVVSTDCPFGPSEILNQGEFGKLVPVGDVDALAAAIRESLECNHDRIRLEARGRSFSLEKTLDQYGEVINV